MKTNKWNHETHGIFQYWVCQKIMLQLWITLYIFKELESNVIMLPPFLLQQKHKCRFLGQIYVLPMCNGAHIMHHIMRNKAWHLSRSCSLHLCFHWKRDGGFDLNFLLAVILIMSAVQESLCQLKLLVYSRWR